MSNASAMDEDPAPFRPTLDLATAEYLLFGLDNIEGWGVDGYLSRLFLILNDFHRQNKIYGNMLEIGVHHGRTAVLLALMSTTGEVSIFVDLFEQQLENIDSSGRGDRQIFEANLLRWASSKHSRVIEANSMQLDFSSIEELSDGIRFAHIDGGHYRDVVLNDIRKTRSVLCDRGVVVVDDFTHTGFPGVNEACNAYLESKADGGLVPVAMGHNKLILTTLGAQADLVEHLRSGLGRKKYSNVRFHGFEILCLDKH